MIKYFYYDGLGDSSSTIKSDMHNDLILRSIYDLKVDMDTKFDTLENQFEH